MKIKKIINGVGEILYALGVAVLFICVIAHLSYALPTRLEYTGISHALIFWFLIGLLLIVIGIVLRSCLGGKKIEFKKHLKGFVSQIIATLSMVLIVIILIPAKSSAWSERPAGELA